MKIRSITVKNFKRFTDLTITDLPESARLIVLVGPNGSGKTSVFEAFNHWHRRYSFGLYGNKDYYLKSNIIDTTDSWINNVNIEFHNNLASEQYKNKFYFRSAYRNEPDFVINNFKKQDDPYEKFKNLSLIQSDITVSDNYQRIISSTISGLYSESNNSKTVENLRNELLGKIKKSISNIFDDLNLNSLLDPINNGSFYFEKGDAKNFHYKNLSAGEKSGFDLILDMIVKLSYYQDAVFCIDEPEAHMHTILQAKVIKELYELTPSESQLWISTHSIGMMKQAEDLEKMNPGSVVFLDFDNRDFDTTEIIKPTVLDKSIWNKFFELAIGSFSQLIAPKQIVFCEGSSQGRVYKDFDAQIYGKIFENTYYETVFISIGSSTELENISNPSVNVVSNILINSNIIKFVDRDDKSAQEVSDLLRKGIKTSQRRHIESYLFDDELIVKLCQTIGKPELINDCLQAKQNALSNSVSRGNPSDDIKSASGEIFNELKRILSLTQRGNNKCAFLRDTITPLITVETNVYQELEREIF